GAGKACVALAAGLHASLSVPPYGGVLITKYGHGGSVPGLDVIEAGHPFPDRAGLDATAHLLARAAEVEPDDVVFFCLTGGASALLVKPAPGLTLDDKIRVTERLLASGADIHEINTVRRRLSAVKGGRLRRFFAARRVVTLAISDVPGDDPLAIGAGPLIGAAEAPDDAWSVIVRRRLEAQLPTRVAAVLRAQRGVSEPPGARRVETDDRFVVLANNGTALRAAARRATELGCDAKILSDSLIGEARVAATHLVREAHTRAVARGASALRPCLLLAGGETTVTVRGPGRGGRNQELALAAGLLLGADPRVTLLAAATDGSDGPTDAAGAFWDAESARKARAAGLDLAGALERNDSYSVFALLGDHFVTGPTGTNVMDLTLMHIV
ncbi:MAG: DUF4147 domain-containing protein, partial [Steroidobacteraceae bacterium]|nr:DUF4147 domain-containing protein [Steroidobacteraceae bacterium]